MQLFKSARQERPWFRLRSTSGWGNCLTKGWDFVFYYKTRSKSQNDGAKLYWNCKSTLADASKFPSVERSRNQGKFVLTFLGFDSAQPTERLTLFFAFRFYSRTNSQAKCVQFNEAGRVFLVVD